jgi:hypothetical protein
MGASAKMTPEEQAKRFGDLWEKLPAPRPQMSLRIRDRYFNMGPHPPRLWPEDIELLHQLWLELTERKEGHRIHHRDVLHIALRRLRKELHGPERDEIMKDIRG